MKSKRVLIGIIPALAVLLFSHCFSSDQSALYPSTLNIDTGAYKQLDKKFKAKLFKAPEYLGGLTPNYPIAIASQTIHNQQEWTAADTGWTDGGFIISTRKMLVKTPEGFKLINNRKELQKVYAPISTDQEALAYAILYTRSFAVFDNFYKDKNFKFLNKKEITSVSKSGSGFIVRVFSYKTFGCDHPYYMHTMRVNQDGTIELINKVAAFKDPADDSLCVD